MKIDLMGTFFKVVALPGIHYHFGLNAERFQRMVKLVSLSNGDDVIDFAVENKRRCSAILNEMEWRVLKIRQTLIASYCLTLRTNVLVTLS